VIKIIFTLVLIVSMPAVALAAMQPMTDEELGVQTGQAFIQIDRNTSDPNYDFSRFTFGLDVDVSMNADLVQLGRYDDPDEPANSSDIQISDFSLGYIDESGNVIPFQIKDPFIELAFDKSGSAQNLVGIRLGFGGAAGKLSGNIEYLNGNLEVRVEGSARPIRDANFLAWLTMRNSDILGADAVLVAGPGEANTGEPISSLARRRANWVGIDNDTTMECLSSGCSLGASLATILTPGGCSLLGITTCFPLKNFKTNDIGNQNALDPSSSNYAGGLYMSFQSQRVVWPESGVTAEVGAFMNIPDGGITLDFEQSFNGIERIRTKFLDPYYD